MVRLGLAEDQPLAVQQWQGLIAINYPARDFGLSRHVPIAEAKQKCPQIICQHVATWREGDDKWAYRDDSAEHIQTDKVSLDPYRLESRKSLALIKEILPAPPVQRVEKASIDEVFLDLSAQIHGILLERYPELKYAPYDDPSEHLPLPPTTALNWEADGLVDLDDDQTEDDDPDWDDVVMNIGSEIVRGVRRTIKDRLKYTCSAGIARNKMMAKLGAGYKKPNQQTIVRNRAIQQFLSGFKFTKIRNLGGKLGEQVVASFGTNEVKDLLKVPVETLKSKFGDDTGTWIYGIIRGEDTSEVSSRTQIKSMLSAKSFRPSINNFEQAIKWIRIFVSDIYARLIEEGVTENKRRPKTMNLHHRQGGQTRSKQLAIPQGKKIDSDMLFDLARNLLQQVIADGRAWPCSNLSLSVGGVEDGVAGNQGIGSFLIRGEEARNPEMKPDSRTPTPVQESNRPEKRRKLSDGSSISRFFKSEDTADDMLQAHSDASVDDASFKPVRATDADGKFSWQQDMATYLCNDCQKQIPDEEKSEHQDWHFAKSLQAEERPPVVGPSNSRPPGAPTSTSKRGGMSRHRERASKPEKGQSCLAFK